MTAPACGDNRLAELKCPKKSHVLLVLEMLGYPLMKNRKILTDIAASFTRGLHQSCSRMPNLNLRLRSQLPREGLNKDSLHQVVCVPVPGCRIEIEEQISSHSVLLFSVNIIV